MGDNKPLEIQAQSLIEHLLLKYNFNVCKPSFDQYGADLLIVDSLTKNPTAFLKIQSKGRSVTISNPSVVTIPIDYVDDKFILFLYTVDDQRRDKIFVFFKQNIEKWNKRDKEYSLNLTAKSLGLQEQNIVNEQTLQRINLLLKEQPVKKYTSLIIDGIFLQKSVSVISNLYKEIHPARKFNELIFEELVRQILTSYNKFKSDHSAINVILYNSKNHSLEAEIVLPETSSFQSPAVLNAKFYIHHTSGFVSFEILDHIERIINAENVILVADDISYESPLVKLKEKGIEVLLVTLQEELGGQIFAGCEWGDIAYPIGLALGLDCSDL